MTRRSVLRHFGGLALVLYLLFGLGSGLASVCCPPPSSEFAGPAGEVCCEILACHPTTSVPGLPCPNCAAHSGQHLRKAPGTLISSRAPRVGGAAQGIVPPFFSRLLPRKELRGPEPAALSPRFTHPILLSLRSVVLLH